MIKAVFFDFYNTLVGYDPPREILEANILREMGMEASPESLVRPILTADEFLYQEHARYPLSKRSKGEMMSLYIQYHGIILKEVGLEASGEIIPEILNKWMHSDFKVVLFDDVAPVLTDLKERGLILGMISNVDRDITPLYQKLGLPNWLKLMVTSQDTGFSKPDPGIFQAALKQAKVKPSEAIYVGDQYQYDVVGANGAGMLGILLDRSGYAEEAADSPRIRSLTELAEYLN